MRSLNRIKYLFILVLVGVSFFGLFPSMRYYLMSDADHREKQQQSDPDYQELKTKILNLGLDLQGGVHLVVEIDVKRFLLRLAKKQDDIIDKAATVASNDELTPITSLEKSLNENGASLVTYFASRRNHQLDEDREIRKKLRDDLSNSIDRALEIVRNRIDQFGVAEPVIQKLGERRIVIEIAGDVNPDRIRKTIFTEARLEFRLVAEESDAKKIYLAVHDFYKKKYKIKDDIGIKLDELDSLSTDADKKTSSEEPKKDKKDKTEDVADASELFGTDSEDTLSNSDETDSDKPAYDKELLLQIYQDKYQVVAVLSKNKPILDSLLEDRNFKKYIRKKSGNYSIVYKKQRLKSGQKQEIYLVEFVKGRIEMDGSGVVDAKWAINPQGVSDYAVTMKFNDKASRKFSNMSERYTGKLLAILLDNVVQSDPVFKEKIPVGSGATISGSMDQTEAKDLSIVLKTGSLPAPLKLIEQETVGASLGEASVKAGTMSTIMGIILVLVFMVVYYKKGGAIASVAVIINMMMIMAALAAFGGTLTLPGIAGIILTIGMSVDANVLIFERIREEITAGARVFAALENGYSRATVAILDANITTFIAGVVLYSYGSGTVRGFALTLMIGILTSLITAVVMTRIVFEATTKKTDQTISV